MSKSKNSASPVSSAPFTLNNYFEFKSWDQQDTTAFTFYDCTVLHPFGPFKKGQTIETIDVDFNSGTIQTEDSVPNRKKNMFFFGYLVMNIVERKGIPENDD